MMDQDKEFTGNVLSALCELVGVQKVCTSLYYPSSNGSFERVHQTSCQMISKLDPEKRMKWPTI